MAATKTVKREDSCPECGATLREATADVHCPDCGYIAEDSRIDYGKEWSYGNSDGKSEERAYPGDETRSDDGMGSYIGHRSERKKMGFEARKNRLNNQAITTGTKKRTRGYALNEVARIVGRMELPRHIRERALYCFREIQHADALEGQDADQVAASCVYAACREEQLGIVPGEIVEYARCEEKYISGRMWWVARELGLEVPPPSVEARICVVAGKLERGSDYREDAIRVLDSLDDVGRGGSPSVLAAACLYEAGGYRVSGGPWTQEGISEAAGCSPRSLRDTWTSFTDF